MHIAIDKVRLASLLTMVAATPQAWPQLYSMDPKLERISLFALWDWDHSLVERPNRRLTTKEAKAWVDRHRRVAPTMATIWRPVHPNVVLTAATADHATLYRQLKHRDLDIRLGALGEIGMRKDTRFTGQVKAMVLAGSIDAYGVYRHLSPSRIALVELLRSAKIDARIRYFVACDLLAAGDPRGADVVRAGMPLRRGELPGWNYRYPHSMGYYLIRYADGNDTKRIAKDLRLVHRTDYPDLAKLRRPLVDRELTRLASAKDHHERKWLAMAAKERPESRAYRDVLERLCTDPVPDVRNTALWALGRRDRPGKF